MTTSTGEGKSANGGSGRSGDGKSRRFSLPTELLAAIILALGGIVAAKLSYDNGEFNGRQTKAAELQPTIEAAQTAIAATPTSSESNRLVTHDDFEDTDNGWVDMRSVQFNDDGTRKSEFPKDSSFPGTMSRNLTKDYSLTGHSSLRVITSVNTPGNYQGYLLRQGTFTGNGVTIYVFTPELKDITINYIQLCVPSYGWACSFGTRIIPGEWTPITLDLSQEDPSNGESLYHKKLDLAIQWNFTAKIGTSHALYFDSVEIFHSDSR